MTNTEPVTRNTWQRRAVAEVLRDSNEFLTAAQIHDELTKLGTPVGLATVYRTVQMMFDNDEVDTIRTPEGEAAYRRCSAHHHHHLVCRTCSDTVEIADDFVEQWANEIAHRYGFTDAGHELEIFGLCPKCSTT